MRFTKASDVMSEPVITLTPEMTLQSACELLFENQISGAPVIDKNGMVVGVLSRTDLLRERLGERFLNFTDGNFFLDVPVFVDATGQLRSSEDSGKRTVADAMTNEPVCVQPNDSVSFLARTMRTRHLHRLIVTDQGKLRGIVSSFDLLKAIAMN